MSNKKEWIIMPKVENKYFDKFPQYDEVVLQLLNNRNIMSEKSIDVFFNGGKDELYDPFLFTNMNEAVAQVVAHIKSGNKIFVFGDFDADGVTASALMVEILKILKADVDIYIPDRVTEGNGLNIGAIDEINRSGAKLIITVDVGIRSKEQIQYAKELGIDVIVTDHHMPPDDDKDLPDCLIINPSVKNEHYPFKYLAGVGVSFKLVSAIIQRSKLSEIDKEKLQSMVLDLVAIGTVADCVSLLGENRVLSQLGLNVLNKTKRMGLIELINISGLDQDKKLGAWNIGFQIAPRINAAGRMNHANTAFELMLTRDADRAKILAEELNENNINRQRETNEIFVEAEAQIDKEKNDKIIICVFDASIGNEVWNEGIVGLVAGKIAEKYYKPTLVITKVEDGYKGSGRSVGEFNIIEAVEASARYLDRFGGHPAACGFSLSDKNLDNFMEAIKDYSNKKLADIEIKPTLKIETEIDFEKIDENLIEKINRFEPFGQNNDRPVFASFGVYIFDIMNMGAEGQHIKLRIKNGTSAVLDAIGFGQSEKWKDLKINDKIDIAYYLEINDFNGRTTPQLRIVDIRPNN